MSNKTTSSSFEYYSIFSKILIFETISISFVFLKTVNNVIEPDNLLPYAPSSDPSSFI